MIEKKMFNSDEEKCELRLRGHDVDDTPFQLIKSFNLDFFGDESIKVSGGWFSSSKSSVSTTSDKGDEASQHVRYEDGGFTIVVPLEGVLKENRPVLMPDILEDPSFYHTEQEITEIAGKDINLTLNFKGHYGEPTLNIRHPLSPAFGNNPISLTQTYKLVLDPLNWDQWEVENITSQKYKEFSTPPSSSGNNNEEEENEEDVGKK